VKLYIWALIDTAFAGVLALLINGLGKHSITRRTAALAIAAGLPLSAVVNMFVKGPLFGSLVALARLPADQALWPFWFSLLILVLVGVTEEAIKLLPLIFRSLRAFLDDPGWALGMGLLFGIGFGVGEAWFLAYGMQGLAAPYTFWQLQGFGGERIFAICIHAFLTAFFVYGIGRNRLWLFYLLAIALHTVADAGAMLYQAGVIPGAAAGFIGQLAMAPVFIYGLLLIIRLKRENRVAAFAGDRVLFAVTPEGETVQDSGVGSSESEG
jgi:uncharacterized membrane protein YhfC